MIRHRLRLQEEEVLGQLRTNGQAMFASSRTPSRKKSCSLYSGVGRWQEVNADENLSQTGARVKRFCALNGATVCRRKHKGNFLRNCKRKEDHKNTKWDTRHKK